MDQVGLYLDLLGHGLTAAEADLLCRASRSRRSPGVHGLRIAALRIWATNDAYDVSRVGTVKWLKALVARFPALLQSDTNEGG
jgi:hypothetical protein